MARVRSRKAHDDLARLSLHRPKHQKLSVLTTGASAPSLSKIIHVKVHGIHEKVDSVLETSSRKIFTLGHEARHVAGDNEHGSLLSIDRPSGDKNHYSSTM